MWSCTFARPPTGRAAPFAFFDGRPNWCLPMSLTTASYGHRSLKIQNGTTLQGEMRLNFAGVDRMSVGRSALRELIRHGIVTRRLVALINSRNTVRWQWQSTCGDLRRENSRFNSDPNNGSTFCNVSVLLSAVDFPPAPERPVRDGETMTDASGLQAKLVFGRGEERSLCQPAAAGSTIFGWIAAGAGLNMSGARTDAVSP